MGQNVGQFLTLPLGADVRTEATLQELEGALILGHLQQLHTALLVRRMANDLADQIAHELGVLGLDTLGAGRADSLDLAIAAVLQLLYLGRLVALVEADADFVSRGTIATRSRPPPPDCPLWRTP